jgi:hypothetical protein
MSTTLQQEGAYAVTSSADNLLKRIRDEIDQILISFAAQHSTSQSGGMTLVDRKEIEKGLENICTFLEEGIKSGTIPPDVQPGLDKLKALYSSLQSESSSNAPSVSASYGKGS